jgi:hypothetical protein
MDKFMKLSLTYSIIANLISYKSTEGIMQFKIDYYVVLNLRRLAF